MSNSFRQDVIKGASWSSLARVGEKIIGYSRIAVLARLLSPDDFGRFGIALLVLSLAETITETGVNQALIQKPGEVKQDLMSAWIIFAVRGLLVTSILWWLAPSVSQFFRLDDVWLIRLIAVSVLLRSWVNPAIVLWQKQLRFGYDMGFQLFGAGVEALVAIGVAMFWPTYWALVIGFIAKAVGQLVISFVVEPVNWNRIRWDTVKKLLSYGRWINANSILSYATHEGDDIVVGRVLGTEQLGLYQNAYKFSLVPVTGNIFSSVAFPLISSQKSAQAKLEKTAKLAWAVAYTSFFVGALIWLFPVQVTLILLGSQWLALAPALQILIMYGVLRALGGIIGQYYPAVGRPQVNTWINTIKLLFVFIPLWPAIQLWGIVGASWVVVVASLMANGLQFFWISREPGFKQLLLLVRPLIALIVSTVSTWGLIQPLHSIWIQLVVGGSIFVLVFASTALWIDPFLRALMIQVVLPRLPRWFRSSFIRVQLQVKRGKWHDFSWQTTATQASDLDWEERYDLQWRYDRHDSLVVADLDWIKEQLQEFKAKSILEIGPGTGQLAKALDEAGYAVSVVDISSRVLTDLVAPVGKVQGRAESLPFKVNTFDVIVATHLLEHVDDLTQTINDWKRVAAKGLVIIVPQEEKPEVSANYHLQYFPTLASLVDALQLETYQVTSHTNPTDQTKYIRYSAKIASKI